MGINKTHKRMSQIFCGKGLILILMTFMMGNSMTAQKKFTLEDLNFGGKNYRNMIPENRYTSWWGEQLIAKYADHCAIVDKKSVKEENLFTLDDINKWVDPDKKTVTHLYGISFPYAEKSLVLIENNTKRMLIDWQKKAVAWSQSKSNESFADWQPFSKNTAYVYKDNLYVRDAENKTKQITKDGSREIVYGQTVHRNEFGIDKGTFWSPDGQKLAFYRMDQSMVADYPLVDIDTPMATLQPEKYPMAGQTSHEVTVGVYDTKTGNTTYLDLGNPKDRYFTNITWSPDNSKIYLIELNRSQTDMSLDEYDATSGKKIRTLYTEHHDKYVHPVHPITFLPWDSNLFILQSEKDGFNHLYLFNTKGKQLKQLTKGKWIVLDLLGFNLKQKQVVILSTEKHDIQANLYAVNIKNGKRRLLDNGLGCHGNMRPEETLSPDGEWIIDSYTQPDVPRKINLIEVNCAKNITYFEAANPWKGYSLPQYKSGEITAADGKTRLYYRMVLPPDFDQSKKYPTIIYVYGGPGARNVEARWNYYSRGWETYMAQKGYIVFVLDNRGSSKRGLDFEQATFKHLGVEEMKDQIKGVEFLKTLPYVDASKLGVHGWSFGGFMTINLMTTYPEVFKVGVAGGPVINWKWYEVMYGERYMQKPQENPDGYKGSNLINKAKNLKGRLQIITGLNDPVVVPQHCISFIKQCIKVETQPDFFVYPGEPHNMRGHQSTHLHERISRYFDDYLK